MTGDRDVKTSHPIAPTSEVLVHTSAARRLAAEHWLLSTLPTPDAVGWARMQWAEMGVAMLPLGGLIAAVRIPAHLVHALAHSHEQPTVDALLAEALHGGPVICTLLGGHRYYALVPGTMPTTWHGTVEGWRSLGVDCLGKDAYLGVPPVTRTEFDTGTWASYWSVPMASAGELCDPATLARLIAAGRQALAAQVEAEA